MPKINTYTDNATIEDVDAVLTYDPSGSGATKLTTFARIASWVSAKLAALGKKTAITSADQILMVNGSAAARIDYNVLAKAIIEQYAGSTVAGSAQSVKAALDALNSKTTYAAVDFNQVASINTEYIQPYVGHYVVWGKVVQFYLGFNVLKECPINTRLFTLTKYLPIEHTQINELESHVFGYINYQGNHVATITVPADGIYRITGMYMCR